MLAIHEFYHDSGKKCTLKQGKFLEIFNVAASLWSWKTWKGHEKVMESQGISRAQKSTNPDGRWKILFISNILARKMHILIMCFCKTRIDLFGLYVMFSHLIEVFIEVFIKKSVMTYVWLYNQ